MRLCKEDRIAYSLYLLFALCVVLALQGCWKKPPIVDAIKTFETPAVNGVSGVEFDTPKTFDASTLPAGIEAKDVAAVITLKPDEPVSTFDAGPSAAVTFDKAGNSISVSKKKSAAPSKASEEIIVMKDGRVIAGKGAAAQIVAAEEVKPSHAWIFWAIAGITALLAAGWGVKQLAVVFVPAAKLVEFVGGLFKRK